MKFFLISLFLVATFLSWAQTPDDILELANKYRQEGKYQQSYQSYVEAAVLLEASKKSEDMLKALTAAVGLAIVLSQPRDAKKHLQRIFASENAYGQRPWFGDVYYFAGQYYHYYTDYSDSSSHFFQRSLRLRQSVLTAFDVKIAQSLIGLADVERYNRKDYIQAEQLYRRALEIFKHHRMEGYWMINVHYSLATTYRLKGEYAKALTFCLEAKAQAEQAHDVAFMERIFSALGNIYKDREQYETSLENFEKALAISRSTPHNEVNTAILLESASLVHFAQGDITEAQRKITNARKLLEQSATLISQQGASICRNTGIFFASRGMERQAVQSFHEAISILSRLQHHQSADLTEALGDLGNFYRKCGRFDSAHFYLKKAISHNQGHGAASVVQKYQYFHRRPLLDLADLYYQQFLKTRQLNWLAESAAQYLGAENLFLASRSLYELEDSKKIFSKRHTSLYERLLRVLFAQHQANVPGADSLFVEVLERSRYKRLSDALALAFAENNAGLPDSLREQERNVRLNKNFYQELLLAELNRMAPDSQKMKAIRESLFSLEEQGRHLETVLQKHYPLFFRFRYGKTEALYPVIRQRAAEQQVAYIEFFWGDSTAYRVLLDPKKGCVINELKNKKDIEKNVVLLLNNLNSRESISSPTRFEQYASVANLLYRQLAFDELSAEITKIVLIPDGVLHGLPFEALLEKPMASDSVDYRTLPYLINSKSVRYSFSHTHEFIKPQRIRAAEKKRILVFAYSSPNDVNRFETMRSEPLSTLPGTYRELTVLERQFQGDGFYYAGREASEKTFKVMANRADIIHLAVHGKAASEASPSGLFFPAAGDSLEDGELHLDEIYNLRLNADLVVLSACETGTGQFFAGEGTESIASAFAYAGGRNVLMSLWRVEDWSTGGLMNAFYRDQNSASSLVDALTSAKRAYLHEADALRAHPSLWAGFILVGDGEHARSAYRDRWWTTLAFALALSSLSVITWLWWRKRKKPLSLWSR